MTMTESSSSEALRGEELPKADEVRNVTGELEEAAQQGGGEKVAELVESECGRIDANERIRALEGQIEELAEKLKKAEESLTTYPLGSPKTVTSEDDEYIVVEQESPESLSFQLREREAEIRKAIAHAKKLEEMYNAAEARTLTFERQVHVLEASMFEKFDDANALIEKVRKLEELLTAGQIQFFLLKCQASYCWIAALEEKSKSSDEAQKKVEYEKVLFLETEDQLVKNFKKAHDEAEQYRSMILQLETSVKDAEEKAARSEKCMEVASQRNQELESEIADLSFQVQQFYSSSSKGVRSESELAELDKALANKVDSLEQELQMYRGRDEKKVDDDAKSVDEKTVVHEASCSSHHHHPGDDSVMVEEAQASSASMIDDEMKFLGDNVVAHVAHSKLLMSQFEKLQSDHIEYACEAESCKTQLKERVKDLEVKVSELEEEMVFSREREERMKQEAKVMEEKASLFEGLKLSYADYTSDLEKKNAKLEEELVVVRGEVAAHTTDHEKWALDCERMRTAEALVSDLQTQVNEACEPCSQLKTQIQDLEVVLGELSLDLQESKRREHDAQKEFQKEKIEWMEKAASQTSRLLALDAQLSQIQKENSQAKASVGESRLWIHEAASLLREHAESLHELRGRGGCTAVDQDLGKEDEAVPQAEAEEELYLKFKDMHLSGDGHSDSALQLCKQLLSLERDCFSSQMLEIAQKNSSLRSELEVVKSELQALQNPPESPAMEVKRSFREVTLEGEVQSLRVQLTELQHLRAEVSEIPSLQAHLAQLQLSLRAAEKRERDQNQELVKVQRKVSAAEEKVCSLKDTLLNQTQINELREQVNLLEQKLTKSEATNASLKEAIDVLNVKTTNIHRTTTDIASSDKITDEVVLDQQADSESNQQQQQTADDVILQQLPKQKARKRKNRKSGKGSISQELIEGSADIRTHSSSRHSIAIFLVSVMVVALVIRLTLR